MSKPIIAVVGATGIQGGSVVQALLKQGEYEIRGITRDVNSDKAKALSTQGVDMVTADLTDEASLIRAFEGATAIFAVTNFLETFLKDGPDQAIHAEYQQGVNMARAALQTSTLKHYIWSTLPNTHKISDGKFVVKHVEGKCAVDEFIKSQPELLAKTTFLWVTYYSSNFFYPPMQPHFLKSIGTYVYISPVAPSTRFSFAGDAAVNVGIFTRAILSNPSQTLGGKFVFGNVEIMAMGDYLQLWGKVRDKRVHLLQLSLEEYEKLFPLLGAEVGKYTKFLEHVGEKAWSVSAGEEVVTASDLGVHGELITLEQAFATTDWSPLDS